MQETKQEVKNSVFTIEDEKKLSITGVSSVEEFSDQTIVLIINGQKTVIAGAHLKILSFSEGNGNLFATGEVFCVRFGKGKKLSKLFQ